MDDYTHVNRVFKPEWVSPYSDSKFVQDIEVMRKEFNGTLFIDRVLRTLGITNPHSYPPTSKNSLQKLHQQVCDSRFSVPHKLSVFYYILLDFDSLQSRPSYAENFAFHFAVPEKYKIFMKGLWLMDRRQFSAALEYLAHPSILPEFADDIVTILVQNAGKVGDQYDYSLALAYYHTVQPALQSSTALSALFEAMAQTSLTEAFYFSRTRPESARQLLFQQLIKSVLGGHGGSDIASRATELVSLPLDGAEEQWFIDYLTNGNGRRLRNAKDTVLMRRVVTGRHAESMNDQSLSSQWGAVLGGFKSGMGGRVA
ncbi:hypothetical protein N0V93_008506 [Gnomoniopsis smithogilvyi]|uniref:ELYS-like domain-containing protein n=1 Tax=Gnomoniopsis smithogilvyi TaxID=1191159 RepID=A0A9W9CUU9_9PEZI|nr:hypothetical protein N0V93_008506 [Gnomoniopsis smithogilvyi]